MHRPRPIRDAAIALTVLTAVPTPSEWLSEERVQAAGWFPAIGGIVAAAGYAVVKAAEAIGLLGVAPYLVATAVVGVWAVVTWGLHWRALAALFGSAFSRITGAELASALDARSSAVGAGAAASIAAVEAAVIGSFLIHHQSPVLCIPMLARFAATAAAWLGTPVPADNPGRALFGRPSTLSALAASAALFVIGLALWAGFMARGLELTAFGLLAALTVPHLLSMAVGGVTIDVLEGSVVIVEVLTFAAFAIHH